MSGGRIAGTYGFGAARVRLCPEPGGLPAPQPGAGRALAGLAAELRARGLLAGTASALRLLPTLALGLVLVLALLLTASREPRDDLHVVRFEAPPPAPPAELPPLPPPAPQPVEAPVVAQVPPPAAVKPPRALPEAATPPRPRVEVPPPAPRPPPRAAPPRPALPPAPQMASAAPERRAPAAERPLPRPAARPRPDVRIDRVARAPTPAPASRSLRAERPAAAPATPRPGFDLALPAAPAPAGRAEVLPAPPPGRPAAPRPGSRVRAARPERLAVAGLPDPGPASRAAPPARAKRVTRSAPSAAPARGRDEPRLAGVPLGSLAACVSDRREDELKLRVMAQRGDSAECASAAGRYRFLETRNLNAFLMWVERAPSRGEADRCVELSFALECLTRRSREI